VSGWLWQKIDVFLAAAVIAVGGLLACQGHTFMAQYVEHLGREVREAGAHLADTQSGLRYRVMGETVRAELEAKAQKRYTALKRSEESIVGANVLTRPLLYAAYRDPDVAADTKRDFKPELPSSAGSIAYVVLGMLVGFIVYEIVKFPVMMLLREPRRRRFRRRG
jgi:hypothetical protein